jgi:hypothetical protein
MCLFGESRRQGSLADLEREKDEHYRQYNERSYPEVLAGSSVD